MKGPLPGKQYIPSNGSAGDGFISAFCSHCTRDKMCSEGKDFDECTDDELCEILCASFRGEAAEWRQLDDGSVTCIAYTTAPVGTPRCANTVDMFEPKEQP